jgi:hypothetical protein
MLRAGSPGHASLFGLAPCGVWPATDVATGAVRSYRTFSPLPTIAPKARRWAVCFLCHFPSGCPDRVLPGALPCGVRTFLPPSPVSRATADDHLAHCGGGFLPAFGSLPASGSRLPVQGLGLSHPASRTPEPGSSAIVLLRDPVLLELLVEIASRGPDDLGGLRDVPVVLAELLDEKRTLGNLLELAEGARALLLIIIR